MGKLINKNSMIGGGAPTDAQYVTLALNGILTAERVLTAGTGIDLTDSGANANVTLSTDDSEIDHNALLNYSANRHFLQTEITNVSTLLSTGLLKVTTGTGALSVITDNSGNWDTAYTHSQDNTQAHSDYLLNNENDETSGTLGAANFKTSGLMKDMTQCWDFDVFNPNIVYNIDTQVFLLYTKSALTITKLRVELNTSAQEVAGDLKYADDFISLANATIINDFDTSSGTRTDTTITSGSVAAGKCIYIQFDSQPNSAITQMHVHIEWDYD
jgi:hypothetical protein